MKCCFATAMLCVGCGRLSFDALGDAGDRNADGGARIDAVPAQVCGAWQPPQRLTNVCSSDDDYGPMLSDDGRSLYLHSSRAGSYAIYVASRATTADPFGAATLIPEIAAPQEDGNPTMTADELVLGFETTRGGSRCLILFTRGTNTEPWANPVTQDALCTTNEVAGAELSGDGLTVYYTRLQSGVFGGTIMVSTRASRADLFPAGIPVAGIDTSVSLVGYPSLSLDALTIYYETRSPLQLWFATRPSLDAPFEAAEPLSVNQVDGAEGDADISRDGQELFFASNRTGGAGSFDIYRATRTCTPVL